jgi:hypothetical protein
MTSRLRGRKTHPQKNDQDAREGKRQVKAKKAMAPIATASAKLWTERSMRRLIG